MSYEYCETFKNTCFEKHLRVTASELFPGLSKQTAIFNICFGFYFDEAVAELRMAVFLILLLQHDFQ